MCARAEAIVDLLHEKGITSVFSVGVGGAGLEYQIKKLDPRIRVVCSEYAPENVEMLKKVFLEADGVVPFDMKGTDWSPAIAQASERVLTLMYRVDPHATDAEWRAILERMRASGVKEVLYLPCGFLTLRSLVQRKLRTLKRRLHGEPVVFSGYLRTRKTFETYWAGLYQAEERSFAGFTGYYLHPAS